MTKRLTSLLTTSTFIIAASGSAFDFQGAAESDSSNLSQPFHLGVALSTPRSLRLGS
jgi:hypothetical protein